MEPFLSTTVFVGPAFIAVAASRAILSLVLRVITTAALSEADPGASAARV